MQKPFIDLRQTIITQNKMMFKGTALHDVSSKQQSGKYAKDCIDKKDWNFLQVYMKDEHRGFIELYERLKHES